MFKCQPLPFLNLGNFVYPTLAVSFGSDTKLLVLSIGCLCQCLSKEMLNTVGPFYLVPMLGQCKRSHAGVIEEEVVAFI